MSRNPSPSSSSSSPMLLLATLVAGVVLGMALDRGAAPLTAQVAGPAKPKAAATPAPEPAAEVDPPPRARGGEDAVYDELARQYDRFAQVNRTFELVARAVSPAVVHIVARKAGHRDEGGAAHYEETGSGVVVRGDRGKTLYVLTNNHVVEGSGTADVHIFLQDGRSLRPERIWFDAKADVAVLKLGRDDLPAARLGNSDDAVVGSWVLALGSPFGLTHSVTQGIISARGRHEKELESDGVENQDFLQTDAAINPGNSGGPLVNLKGEVIGINTAIASNGGGSEGVGFSIPINLARWIMGQLVASGRVARGAMGVDLEDVKADQAVKLGLERPRGAQVRAVHPGSPAARAGLAREDVVLRFNGVAVADLNHLINLVSMAPIGKPAALVVWRDGREQARSVTVADRDLILAAAPAVGEGGLIRRPTRPKAAPEGVAATPAPALGLDLVTLDAATARRLNLPEALRGAAVAKVDPAGPLAAYFRPLDVITRADNQPIRTADDAIRALGRRADRGPVDLVLQRQVDGTLRPLAVRVP